MLTLISTVLPRRISSSILQMTKLRLAESGLTGVTHFVSGSQDLTPALSGSRTCDPCIFFFFFQEEREGLKIKHSLSSRYPRFYLTQALCMNT